VAFDRNFLWKKELGAQFEKSFLFRNIWNKYPMDPRYESLKPCFAKIASTLYIHQEPLQEKTPPNFCQLFGECDKADDFKVFKSTVDDS
jgi:inositol 1,4,5-triphosphate receptor type 1/inositol 1,4,5-triphosphate receptor type 3